MSERITIQTIENKQFDIKPRGYDREEVDTFLDAICDEIERMNNETAALRQQLREAQAAVSRAQQAAQAAQAQASRAPQPQPQQPAPAPMQAPERPKPAPQPVQQQPAPAGGNADIVAMLELAARLKNETIADAKKKAEEILADADARAKEHLENLESERESLTKQVEALRKTASDYRTRFESLLQAQQDALDKISDL